MDYSKKKTLKDLTGIAGKKVIVRVDFNVPLKAGVISDDNRIQAALPTIKYLIGNNAQIILMSHLGRIKTEEDKKQKSLAPIAEHLAKLLTTPVKFVPQTRGSELEAMVNNLHNGEVLVVENTRFEDVANGVLVKKESKNDPELGKYWASLADIFVNDAFGTAHRAHASNVGISSNIKISTVGLLIEKELTNLARGIDHAQRPFVAILGGAKVSDKIAVIDNLLQKVDKILIGGGMAYTFLKAQGHNIGKSLLEVDKLDLARSYLEKANGKIILPVDSANSTEFADNTPEYSGVDIPDDYMGLDIGPKTISLFQTELQNAQTVVWNGPMGVSEFKNFAQGTIAVCETIANLTNAFTLIGGGDSAAAAISLGYKDSFSWISTGGGASLEYMEGKDLPGIKAIQDK